MKQYWIIEVFIGLFDEVERWGRLTNSDGFEKIDIWEDAVTAWEEQKAKIPNRLRLREVRERTVYWRPDISE